MGEEHKVKLSDVGEGIVEAEVAAVLVKPGESVSEDQVLIEIMTEKVTIEIPSPVNGVVREVKVQDGDVVVVGSLLVSIDHGDSDKASEAMPDANTETSIEHSKAAPLNSYPPEETLSESDQLEQSARSSDTKKKVLAAPAIRRQASELGVALENINGTGPGGIITSRDLEDITSRRDSESSDAQVIDLGKCTELKISGVRGKTAEKVAEAKTKIPHFSYVEEFDLTELEATRARMNVSSSQQQTKVTLLPFFMRALAELLPEFPIFNARYDDSEKTLRMYEGIHIGIATQTDHGLLVPVIFDSQRLGLRECASELSEITNSVRSNRANVNRFKGSTITITSLGLLGGITSTPVINYPEVAILAPNKIIERPVVLDGEIVIRKMMNVSASFDHRIIDGYQAALFIKKLRELLEGPDSGWLGLVDPIID